MALEDLTGTKYIDDLNSSNPAAGDNVSEGDDHIRGIKNVLKTTFPNIDGAVNATDTELNYLDITTLGTSEASKALTADANGTVTIDQDTDNEALIIDSEATSYGTAVINGKYPLMATQDVSSGYAGKFTRNIAEAGSYPLVRIVDNHTSNTQPALYIQQDGAGYGIEIDQNGNSKAIYIDSEATSYNVIHSNGKYGIRSNQDISGGYAIYAYRNIDEAGSYPLLRITDDHTSNTQPALKIQQDGAGYGLHIDQNGDAEALYIDSESTSDYAIRVTGKYGLRVEQDISDGRGVHLTRNLNEAGSSPLVYIVDDHVNNTQPALKIEQDGAGKGIYIDQNGNSNALYIESASVNTNAVLIYSKYGIFSQQTLSNGRAAYFTRGLDEAGSQALVQIVDNHISNTQPALSIQQDGNANGIEIASNTTTRNGIYMDASALTTGRALNVYSNSATTDTRNLVEIWNDHASSTGTTALYVNQDSTGFAIDVDAETTTGRALDVECNVLTTGHIAKFYSNSSDTSTRQIFVVKNDHVDSTGTTALYVDNDSTGLVADFEGAGGIRSAGGILFGTDTAAANALDDYEEGTWTPTFQNVTVTTYDQQYGYYTRIGNRVFFDGICSASNIDNTDGSAISILGLPFTISDNTEAYPSVSLFSEDGVNPADNQPMALGIKGSTYILMYVFTPGTGDTTTFLNYSDCGSALRFRFSGHYIIS